MADVTLGPGEVSYDASGLDPGDTIYLNAGTYTRLQIRDALGTAESPITITNTGGLVVVDSPVYDVTLRNPTYVNYRGDGDAGYTYGIKFTGGTSRLNIYETPSHVECSYLEFSGTGGLNCNDATDSAHVVDDIHVHHCYFHDGEDNLYIGGSNWSAPANYKKSNIIVEYCVFYNITTRGIKVVCQEGGYIRYNTFLDVCQDPTAAQETAFTFGPGSAYDGKCYAYCNEVRGSGGYGAFSNGSANFYTDIYNNLLVDTGQNVNELGYQDAIYCDNKANVFNNTIIGAERNGIRCIDAGESGNHAYNNVVLDTTSDSISMAAGSEDHNDTKEGGYTPANYGFVDQASGDYHLLSTSDGVDSGTNTGAPSFDLDDVVRPQNGTTDKGCYEYFTSPPAPAGDITNESVLMSDRTYLEQVTFAEPYTLQYVGSDDMRLSTYLAQKGLPGA